VSDGVDEPGFVEYVFSADLRFLQERRLPLDLYFSGFGGMAVFCLTVASCTVFFLALFQLFARKRHVVSVLLGMAVATLATGWGTTWSNFHRLGQPGVVIVRPEAGASPVNLGQEAAVVAFPLLLGTIAFLGDVLGCIYLAVFWSGHLLPERWRRAR